MKSPKKPEPKLEGYKPRQTQAQKIQARPTSKFFIIISLLTDLSDMGDESGESAVTEAPNKVIPKTFHINTIEILPEKIV
jgi:hypothetical protein